MHDTDYWELHDFFYQQATMTVSDTETFCDTGNLQ